MDDEKLVEAVARAIMCAETGNDECQTSEWADENWCCCEAEARAAIAVIRPAVIEECARVAKTCRARNMCVGKYGAIELWREDICDAIRALAAPRVEQEEKP